METNLPLLNGRITLESAMGEDDDVLRKLSYPEKRAIFWVYLDQRRAQIAAIVSRHLNIPQAAVQVSGIEEWIHGSFNACVPISIIHRRPDLPQRVMIRFALPYRTGEEHFPGNIDEKVRCEAATYIWLQKFCPDVPIPRLFGFGLPGTTSFTAVENESFHHWILWQLKRFKSWIWGCSQQLAPYFAHPRQQVPEVGYLLIEYVDQGKMLSQSWKADHGDQVRSANLYRDLSRIMLSLAKLPLPRIGAFTTDNEGFVSLTNRPLSFQLQQLENCGATTGIPREVTYTSTEPYYLDLLATHDQRMRHQPNSIHHQEDGEGQLAALTMMRSMLTNFVRRDQRADPFVLTLTDLHQSNIFVDDDWHITRLIDLEWASVRPIEMLNPPYWLSSRSIGKSALGIDQVIGEELNAYEAAHKEFMKVFEAEEQAICHSDRITSTLRACWDKGTFWYMQALDCPSALYAIFMFHIQPRFADLSNAELDEFSRVVMPYWSRGTAKFIAEKMKEQARYEDQLKELFVAAEDDKSSKSAE